MSIIKKCEAIVLRSTNYQDTSKILTLYTKEFGKLSAIAKGCRSPQSKYASAFELGSHISLVLYKKSTREVQNISDASVKTPFLRIPSSLERVGVMMEILELVRLTTEEEDAQPKIFNLLLESLRAVDSLQKNVRTVLFYFQAHLIALLGFQPRFGVCVISLKNLFSALQSASDKQLWLLPEYGGVALRVEAERLGLSGKPISVQALRWIQRLLESQLREVENLHLQPALYSEVSDVFDAYFRYHIEDLPPLRSREVFNALMR
ncbi:MAG: DNA repair protein RecO [Chloroherpetonaceae bacterium]|nr:DNA repair protein RecO [Chloroherpetonaceae bacterium]